MNKTKAIIMIAGVLIMCLLPLYFFHSSNNISLENEMSFKIRIYEEFNERFPKLLNKDNKAALLLLRKASVAGHPTAMEMYGTWSLCGTTGVVPKNTKLGIKILEKLAKEDPNIKLFLGQCFYNGCNGQYDVPIDKKRGMKLMQEAKKEGSWVADFEERVKKGSKEKKSNIYSGY